ncbi:unnamed protein product [Absidia cylindrospora]
MVSGYALSKCLEQYDRRLESYLPPCTNTFTTTMGLLCIQGAALEIEDLHRHWWISGHVIVEANERNDMEVDEQEHGGVQSVLHQFARRYQEWPLMQQIYAQKPISSSLTIVRDPMMRR